MPVNKTINKKRTCHSYRFPCKCNMNLVMNLYFQQHLEINQAQLDARCSNFLDNIFPKI